ncbi:DNA cytosine methyltransferase [Blastopirellula retiformator]|uniref:DNA (cytosine-5-)-methyltransferase n=1 Tax=Blastopirellula retiformator TaxID=2527970 RepID=A0A5C5VM18_9BACT|nr:DNA (cytosine-5-)-methyltransferase [Blastopirellula retiformator]TWT39020.1 Modification methylase HhaI [Blastopirellula retiformator]
MSAPAPRTFAEFFAGIGLVRLGLERSGWEVRFANDIDAGKRRQYEGHFGADDSFVLGDVHQLDVAEMPDVTLATASFPCTDLSLAGGRKGLGGAQSSAFWGFHNVLKRLGGRRPPLVLLENVPGLLNSHGGADFAAVLSALNDLGYRVDPIMLDAKWFTPQSRLRLFVVAKAVDDDATIESEDLTPSQLRPAPLVDFVQRHPEIIWSCADLPEPPTASDNQLGDVLEKLPKDDPSWWSQERAAYLLNQMSPRHRAEADAMIAKRRWSYGAVFRRVRRGANGEKRSMAEMRTDGLAGCLRTPKGGSGRQILFKAGYGQYAVRLLTPRECARLMGAGEFTISGSNNDALFGFGDAVCSSVLNWIGENYLNRLAGECCSPRQLELFCR